MKVLLAITLFVAVAQSAVPKERILFNKFKLDYERVYENEAEEELRFGIFSENYRKIQEHNLSGRYSWTKGINQFTDRTEDEFKSTLGYKASFLPNMASAPQKEVDMSKLPKSVDWSKKGATTPIKNQGNCGSCWAFATTEQIESYTFLTNKTLPVLAPQQIVSCTPDKTLGCGGTGGCSGGLPQLGFTYTNLEGIVSEKDYPYTSGKSGIGGQCTYNPKKTPPVATVSGYEALPTNDYESVMHHLATVGPLSIVGAAMPWQSYSGGVFDGCSTQENIQLDHAIQLVGYGTDPKYGDYWKVRNSWGPTWGEKGFIRLKRHSKPYCGYDSQDVIGCEVAWDHKVQVCGTCGILFNPSYPIDAFLL